ncbi:androgen-induced gene 1 protein [Octopus bimaculoides]|uniref:Androgen-dependent TFPI-regulating protein n=1 Tax=Octopus bimaculoides TaxID=37653 RepID=A0A0L8G981_OCTBM|nr:androgen-induced gene 1 protein [Octopus bimaculoides]|eukprot:XP_014782995.1 PREDICTED: androgen-dependent TFPI-regulating protein-like [Octopus bimaculoides]
MAIKRDRKVSHHTEQVTASPLSSSFTPSKISNLSLYICFFHLIAFILLAFGTYTDTFEIQYGWNTYFGKFKYLTYWNIWIQTLYFVISLLYDLMKWRSVNKYDQNKVRQLQIVIDHVHATIVFPVGIFVVITFWLIYHFDRELVFPSFLDEIVPGWLNHILHTLPLVLLFLDKYLVPHCYPPKLRGIGYTFCYTSIYVVWILFLAFAKGIWVYPILQILNNQQRFVFIALLWLFGISIYLVGDGFTCFMWRASAQPMKTRKNKVK